MTVNEKIALLRQHMEQEGIDAFIVVTADPHQSEYPAACWQDRRWLSGFSGSAGTLVVTRKAAGLWTDFRYYLEAEDALSGTEISLHKMDEKGVPPYPEWLAEKLAADAVVGIDGSRYSLAAARNLRSTLSAAGIRLRTDFSPLEQLWTERPPLPTDKAYAFDAGYAGRRRGEKLNDVRKAMMEAGSEYFALASLDDIAWLFNIRGTDVAYNPLVVSYALIGQDTASLFVSPGKVDEALAVALREEGISLFPYNEFFPRLARIPGGAAVYLSPEQVSTALREALPDSVTVREGRNITTDMKAVKNETEIRGVRNALLKDSRALLRFHMWLEEQLELKDVAETEAAAVLTKFRSREDLFAGESFPPIVAFADHGAIVHYRAMKGSEHRIASDGLLLIDSGAHYLDGTTDITRVFCFKEQGSQARRDYSLVLKGHIALAEACFPAGTTGHQLDTLARSPLWEAGINYGHGTGHGIGFFLNVHEGPQRISRHASDVAIRPGMITSNEPGIYREGNYGIRLENLILAIEKEAGAFGRFFAFETLTFYPFEPLLIDADLLSDREVRWLDRYHEEVYRRLAPLLSDNERQWLQKKTAAL